MVRLKIHWQYGCYEGLSDITIGASDTDLDYSDSDWLDGQEFWIFEGNGACDCNRGDWLCGDDFMWETGYEHNGKHYSCGEDIAFLNVDFYRDGRYIGSSGDFGW